MIIETVFHLIMNQTNFSVVDNIRKTATTADSKLIGIPFPFTYFRNTSIEKKENYHHDHIPVDSKGIGILFPFLYLRNSSIA